jgi:Cu2+-exporting ATPase
MEHHEMDKGSSEHSMHHDHSQHDVHVAHAHQSEHESHHDHAGHHDHSGHHLAMIKDFRRRFYISLVITLPVLALSEFMKLVFGFSLSFPGSSFVLFALATFIYFYGGFPFLKGFVDEIRQKTPGMMTLIALAISVAYIYSAAVTFNLISGNNFYWELATLIDIMLAGHWIEMVSVVGASNALEKLARLMPEVAHRKRDSNIEDIPLSEVARGDILVIKPGEKIPADGIVVRGHSFVNESLLTGESKPVEKETGARVIGGAINADGTLDIRVEGTGADSYLAKVINMVRQAQETKSKTQALSDKAAFWLTIVSITVGASTFIAWLLAGKGTEFSITRMVTVMVITCPHALGLAIPLVVAVSTSKSAQHGLLIRNRTAFENARKITAVLFDKTGTLTAGSFEVTSVVSHAEGWDEKRILSYAASLESPSEHPIAQGIVRKAQRSGVGLKEVTDFLAHKGEGVEGKVEGVGVAVVSPRALAAANMAVPRGAEGKAGVTRVFVVVDHAIVGSIGLSDAIRPDAAKAIETLQKRGIKCYMVTGDNRETAKAVSEELGMDGYFAEVLPDEKQMKVKELQSHGEFVAMTGDGVNDAPALAQADIGIAVGSGTDVAAATADIVLVNSNPSDIVSLILFGSATYRKMIQNLAWATGYNVVAIPLAAGILYNQGILLSPALGAVFMSLSTIIVAINARLLKVERI